MVSAADLITMTYHGYWVEIVAGYLLLATLYYLFRCATTDPGFFLRLPPESTYKWHSIALETVHEGKNVQLRYCC